MNNVTMLLPPGTNPQPYVDWPDFARNRSSCARSA